MIDELVTQVITMTIGGTVTGVAWLVRSVLKCQRDIDAAHHKLRGIYDSGFLDKDRSGPCAEGTQRDVYQQGGYSCPKCLGEDDRERS